MKGRMQLPGHVQRIKAPLRLSLLFIALASTGVAAEPRLGGKTASEVFGDPRVGALISSALRHDELAIKAAIASGASVNAVGYEGMTPLAWVETASDVKAMMMLMDNGADPNFYAPLNPDGLGVEPPLWLAASRGAIEQVDALIRHGANVNTTFGNSTPLIIALRNGHRKCATVLVSNGADVNLRTSKLSALIAAGEHGDFKSAKWILELGFSDDLAFARKFLEQISPAIGFGQSAAKKQVLATIDQRIVSKATSPK